MVITHGQTERDRPISHPRQGFTLVEVMVAGTLLVIIIIGVARVSIQAITSGRHRMERDMIEAAIHDNIQLIQQVDSKLTLESIPKSKHRFACLNPAQYLKQQLEKKSGPNAVLPPEITTIDGRNPISRMITTGENPGIALVTYEFSAPEHSIESERRIVELNPYFQTYCILE